MKLFVATLFLSMSFELCQLASIKEDYFKSQNMKKENCKCPKKNEKPMDCGEVQENGNTESGIYTIWPRNRISECSSIEVYCDMETAGGGWIVIQRRGQFGNGENFFVKKWKEYKTGFGNIKKEFWLGNDKIYSLTNQGKYAMRLDMTHGNGTSAFAVYENFWIDNEDSKYKLHLSEYSGTAGDSFSTHDGTLFYTVDQPNPPNIGKRSGGWWFNHVKTTSLNGLNIVGTDKVASEDGINWYTFGGYKNSLEATEIKIRLKNYSV